MEWPCCDQVPDHFLNTAKLKVDSRSKVSGTVGFSIVKENRASASGYSGYSGSLEQAVYQSGSLLINVVALGASDPGTVIRCGGISGDFCGHCLSQDSCW